MMTPRFRYFILTVFLSLGLIYGCSPSADSNLDLTSESYDDLGIIEQAFKNHQSNLFVSSSGIIKWILDDDLKPPRHQRFIVRLENNQTLLVLNNIDIAPRIEDLRVGDMIYFRGEYVWNDKGGMVHWTHRDPSGRSIGGWIKYNGKIYR
ncbi:MAG: DUF3465 domain-containing protein [Candidatus Omnitrophota bacterium]